MNFNLYIFGKSSGYMQYPNDYISFKEYYKNQRSSSLLSIKRDADLVYYIYTQKIDDEKESYFGFCLVFNGVYINKTKGIFTLFEKAFSDCVLQGKLLKIGQNGKITFATDDFCSQNDEFDRIETQFNEELENSKTFFSVLPQRYVLGHACNTFTISVSAEKMGEAISTYDSISIPNNSNDNLANVRGMIRDLYDKNQNLETQYAELNKQKKQYRWVAILSITVITILIGSYFLNKNLQDSLSRNKTELNTLNKNLAAYKDSLKIKEKHISKLDSELLKNQASLKSVEAKFSSLKNTFPINITNIEIGNTYYDGRIETNYGDIIYSKNTMYLKPKISYTGIDPGRSINLKVKWYKPNESLSTSASSPSGFSQQSSLYVYSGFNTETLTGWGNKNKGHWAKGTYRIEIWYENVCLKAKTFTIY